MNSRLACGLVSKSDYPYYNTTNSRMVVDSEIMMESIRISITGRSSRHGLLTTVTSA